MRVKDALGRYGEDLAVAHLRKAGMEVLARNWRCAEGELDIVARDGSTLVVVEVKTRSSTAFGSPAEAVGPRKAARLRLLAARYLADLRSAGEGCEPGRTAWPVVRFDVVAVVNDRRRGVPVTVEHLQGVLG